MQHLFTSAPMVKMHLKPVVGVLLGQRTLGALHPPLASVSLLGFFPLFSLVKAFDSQKGHQALYFPCLAKSGFLCFFEHFTPTYFPWDWSSLSQLFPCCEILFLSFGFPPFPVSLPLLLLVPTSSFLKAKTWTSCGLSGLYRKAAGSCPVYCSAFLKTSSLLFPFVCFCLG